MAFLHQSNCNRTVSALSADGIIDEIRKSLHDLFGDSRVQSVSVEVTVEEREGTELSLHSLELQVSHGCSSKFCVSRAP